MLALIVLCMQLLLPFAHAMQMRSDSDGLSGLAMCSVAKPASTTNQETPSQASAMRCPICIASASQHWAPLPAPSVLPSAREHISIIMLVRNEGFFIPTSFYTLPPSHAPPSIWY